MPDAMTFAGLDAAACPGRSRCSLCNTRFAWMRFSLTNDEGISSALCGFCCSRCAGRLLIALEQVYTIKCGHRSVRREV